MAEHTPELSAIASRLERLEKENQRLKIAGLLVLLVGATVLVMGQARPRRTLEAERFLLKDAKGRVRAELSMEFEDRPTLTFSDGKGLPLVSLAGGDEPFLVLNRAGSNEQVSLQANRLFYGLGLYGAPHGAAGGIRAGLAVHTPGPAVTLYDKEGKERTFLGMLPGAGPTLGLSDETGEFAAMLSVTSGKASFKISDKEGFETTIGSTDLVRARTGETHKTSAASIVLFGKDKKVLWSAP